MKKIFLFALAALTFGFTACVEDEVYKGIISVNHNPGSPTPDNNVDIVATTTGIASLTLKYKAGSAAEESLTMASTKNDANTVFKATIPAQADGTKVTYYVEGEGKKSPTKEYTVSAEVFDYSALVLNEVDGVNKSVELFNKGNQTLPLTNCKLIKNNEAAGWWTGEGASGSIAPGAYVVIKQGNTIPGLIGGGGISTKKTVKFELMDPTGTSLGVFIRGTEANIDANVSDVGSNSYQRIPNGTGDWKMGTPTNGAKNLDSGETIPQD